MHVTRVGAIAREILNVDGPCEVIAVFERSFYLACPAGIVCVGRDIGAGPINLEMPSPPQRITGDAQAAALDWPALNVLVGLEGDVSAGVARLSHGLELNLDRARDWAPSPSPPLVPEQARNGIALLRSIGQRDAPSEGLARLVLCDDASDRTARAAKEAVDTLRARLPGCLASGQLDAAVARAATLLLGMGPGLTPSGDDLLGGVMLALTTAGYDVIRDALWHALEPELGDLTVPISAMHLSAAADGTAAEVLHHLHDAVLRDDADRITTGLAAVGRAGHTSGWDAAAGIAVGLEAALALSS